LHGFVAETGASEDWAALQPLLLPTVHAWLQKKSWEDAEGMAVKHEPLCAALGLYNFLLRRDSANVSGQHSCKACSLSGMNS